MRDPAPRPVAHTVPPLVRRFYLGFALLAAALVLAGFTRTFFLPLARRTFTAPWCVYIHGTSFFTWMTLLVAQASLVIRRRVSLHRRLAVVLIPCMVFSTIAVATWATARDYRATPSDQALAFYFGELMDMVMFGAFATGAYLTRRRPATHKRLILLATLAVLGAAIGRIPVIGAGANDVTLAMLGTILVADLITLPRPHAATIVGGAALILGIFTEDAIGATPQWLTVGTRIINHVHYGLPHN